MKNPVIHVLALIVVVAMLAGCATSGVYRTGSFTNVELSENNFQIVATNVYGEAEAAYLFGASGGIGSEMRTIALIRLEGDGLLYKAALENLWSNFEQQYGSIEGRPLALVNVRYDSDALNVLGIFTKPKISIRADVVEFVE